MMLVARLGGLIHTIDDRIIGMSLHMLLQILGPFERLAAELASMWLQRYMDSNV